MKKNTLKENIKKCGAYARKTPKTIMEAIQFETDDDIVRNDMDDIDGIDSEDEELDTPMEHQEVEPSASKKAAILIDKIRKESLQAMAALADTPEDENYLMLKKVWQMTDRKPEKEDKQMQ